MQVKLLLFIFISMADCMQFLSENCLNRCQIFGLVRFLKTESEPNFGLLHVPTRLHRVHVGTRMDTGSLLAYGHCSWPLAIMASAACQRSVQLAIGQHGSLVVQADIGTGQKSGWTTGEAMWKHNASAAGYSAHTRCFKKSSPLKLSGTFHFG